MFIRRVFSLTEIDSVNELNPLRSQIVRLKEVDGIPEQAIRAHSAERRMRLSDSRVAAAMVLVGNKCDLKEERQVPREVGIALSTLWKDCPYCASFSRDKLD
jgi:GTPase SAR1 family protein